jgi:hypothetical protein
MAVCCQILPLGALSSRSAPSVLVGELFKKFSLFLNTCMCVCVCVCINIYVYIYILSYIQHNHTEQADVAVIVLP